MRAQDDDDHRRMLVAIMNRYDIRPSDAGTMLSDMDDYFQDHKVIWDARDAAHGKR